VCVCACSLRVADFVKINKFSDPLANLPMPCESSADDGQIICRPVLWRYFQIVKPKINSAQLISLFHFFLHFVFFFSVYVDLLYMRNGAHILSG